MAGHYFDKDANTRLRDILFKLFLIFISIRMAWGFLWQPNQRDTARNAREATRSAQTNLTIHYGEQISEIIYQYELERLSPETDENPERLANFATGHHLEFLQKLKNLSIEEGINFRLSSSPERVKHIRVLDFELSIFKAIACLDMSYQRFSLDGIQLSQSTIPRCGIYVFFYENDYWKLAAYFETTDPSNIYRDWQFVEDWEKEIIGELPNDPSMLQERTP
ncbi:MAG TPA: hypothetical protein VLL52_02655 [Anaerolineae bacterium]|nr:hypothetical protein [Anaerolineae bacterium]